MMALLFGYFSYAIHEVERLLEIGKFEFAPDVVFLIDGPIGNAIVQLLQFLAMQGRHTAAAGNALFIGKLFGHEGTPEVELSGVNYTSPKTYLNSVFAKDLATARIIASFAVA